MIINELIDSQRLFFFYGRTKETFKRVANLKKLKDILKSNEKLLYEAIYKDFGKSKYETYETELSLIYHEINVAVKKLKRWSKPKKVRTNIPNMPGKSFIIPEPLGIVLVIGAWNYPYQLSLIPLISAVAAGNTVILKPSELSKNTSEVMAELINSNFESEFLYVYEGGVKETSELLEQKFDKIFFTGSIPVGKIVYEAAAKHLTPVTLELGGKSPVFVLKDCDLKMTAKRIVWGKFLNAGQTCVAPDYILVDQEIKVNLLNEMKKLLEKLFPKKTDISENYVRIINEKNFIRLTNLIDKDKIFFGGETDIEKLFIYPTIINNVSFSDKIMDDEIFGPILPIISFTELNDVIKEVKSRPKPLALYVFGKRGEQVDNILSEISFGGGAVNDTVLHLSNGNLPFGGVGTSGTGNYHEHAGFKAFSHYKSILSKPTVFEPFLKYPPYKKYKLFLLKKMLE
jgi:aldehyde dehydrogenase (NAD+)